MNGPSATVTAPWSGSARDRRTPSAWPIGRSPITSSARRRTARRPTIVRAGSATAGAGAVGTQGKQGVTRGWSGAQAGQRGAGLAEREPGLAVAPPVAGRRTSRRDGTLGMLGVAIVAAALASAGTYGLLVATGQLDGERAALTTPRGLQASTLASGEDAGADPRHRGERDHRCRERGQPGGRHRVPSRRRTATSSSPMASARASSTTPKAGS